MLPSIPLSHKSSKILVSFLKARSQNFFVGKNLNFMADIDKLEFSQWPIWERQDDEPENSFIRFQKYFLPLPKCSLTLAYQKYLESEKGTNRQVKNAPGSWRDECRIWRWRERWQSYHRKLAIDCLAWREEQQYKLITEELRLSQLLMDRASELLQSGIGENDRLKDAPALIRAASELSRRALTMDGLPEAIDKVHRSGLLVIEPSLDVNNEENL